MNKNTIKISSIERANKIIDEVKPQTRAHGYGLIELAIFIEDWDHITSCLKGLKNGN